MRSKGLYYALIAFFSLCLLSAMIINTDNKQTPERAERADYIAKLTVTPTPTATPSPTQTPTPTPIVYEEITVKVMYTESLGYYFITAYSPLETGSWYTATDTYCHRADEEYRYSDPTTCAIDPSLHDFGDLFYIEEFDRVFVAEDTGGAVLGKHIDICFTDDTLESVYNFPTGYYEVYSVYYEEITLEVIKGSDIPIIKEVITEEELEELYQLEEVR